MNRLLALKIATLAVLIMIGGTISAGACQIEAWRWNYIDLVEGIDIEGTTTCEKGEIIIRAYDESREFVGTYTDLFEGYAFVAYINHVPRAPKSLAIKHTIKLR